MSSTVTTKTFMHVTRHFLLHMLFFSLELCADPESFVRGGPNVMGFFSVFLVDKGRKDQNTTISWPSFAHQLAYRCWPNTECWLDSYVIFQGIRISIAKKRYIFVIFQVRGGGGLDPRPSSGSAHENSELEVT